MDDLDHQSEGTRKTLEESPLPLVDKADVREEPVKRKRCRPKLAEGEKGNYRRQNKRKRASRKLNKPCLTRMVLRLLKTLHYKMYQNQ